MNDFVTKKINQYLDRIERLEEELGLLQAVVNRLADGEYFKYENHPEAELDQRIQYAQQFATDRDSRIKNNGSNDRGDPQ